MMNYNTFWIGVFWGAVYSVPLMSVISSAGTKLFLLFWLHNTYILLIGGRSLLLNFFFHKQFLATFINVALPNIF